MLLVREVLLDIWKVDDDGASSVLLLLLLFELVVHEVVKIHVFTVLLLHLSLEVPGLLHILKAIDLQDFDRSVLISHVVKILLGPKFAFLNRKWIGVDINHAFFDFYKLIDISLVVVKQFLV